MASGPKLGSVLVIGGCGFLGHHVVNLLLQDYVPSKSVTAISVVDLRCDRNRRPDADGVRYFEADITNSERLVEIFEEVRPDVVVHTASPAPQASSNVSDALFYKVNVEGTRGVIDASKKAGVRCLVYTSSASVVSDNKSDLINADERWPVIRGKDQTEYYSETKAAAEELVLAANDRTTAGGLLTCAIRPSGIMGEGDTMLLYHMVGVYRQRRHNVQIGDNNNLFDFTYVLNIAHAHLLAAQALRATVTAATAPLDHERVDGEAFFQSPTTVPCTFGIFGHTVWKYAGNQDSLDKVWVLSRGTGLVLGLASEIVFSILRKPPTFNRQRIVYTCMTRYYDISKAKRLLGYKPIVSLEEGIKRGVAWFMAQDAAKAVKA
ncbi:c-3 sterol dehydrogenase c-4 decarboxylase [Grosmannia clavigera kw1407]|uniref:Sterol-4-alpha-carboxylate 3-dehydrogenase ERG26, decarboxylating n=1 Tax=Grosmannia clavigera (strain kw1407 / UAMH 11150) TaxID=655863 RepID=F0XIG8_GROCL|nr:c-3 sterol dehydrogenase c-4 decarboxylase [Grosmannia clavigera kw1407]EFX02520.1 c-3 sterol dehydrogenase c-4 decarboxylase [Grosmannia clavigera kw1407]